MIAFDYSSPQRGHQPAGSISGPIVDRAVDGQQRQDEAIRLHGSEQPRPIYDPGAMKRLRSEAGTATQRSLDAALGEAQKKVNELKQAARDLKARLKQAKKTAKRAKKAARRARKTPDARESPAVEDTPDETSSAENARVTPAKPKPSKKTKTAKTTKAVVKAAKAVSKTKAAKRAKKRAPASERRRRAITDAPPPNQAHATDGIPPAASPGTEWNQDEWTADVSAKAE